MVSWSPHLSALSSILVLLAWTASQRGFSHYFRTHFLDQTFKGLYSPNFFDLLLLVPYFLFAAHEPDVMVQLTQDLENGAGSSVSFFGKALELSAMAPDRFRWIVKQAYRLERSDSGCIRDAVRRYFMAADKFIARAGKRDSVLDSSEAEIERELGAVE